MAASTQGRYKPISIAVYVVLQYGLYRNIYKLFKLFVKKVGKK